jgi:hypothetical protein
MITIFFFNNSNVKSQAYYSPPVYRIVGYVKENPYSYNEETKWKRVSLQVTVEQGIYGKEIIKVIAIKDSDYGWRQVSCPVEEVGFYEKESAYFDYKAFCSYNYVYFNF